ncbi:MAG TPA: hypothetical protein VK569_03630, partial [Bacteroidota bacterium]|nr:hypothetical protein [Bacteroidota bacterium]
MKRLKTALAIMSAAALICATAAAQDTIKVSDVASQFQVGNFTNNRNDSTVSSVNIGQKGSSSWDFSGLKNNGAFKLTSVAVGSSPYAANFSGATHVFQTNILYNYQGTLLAATAYVHFQLGTNLLNMGEGATVPNTTLTLLASNSPFDVFYKLPSTYGTTWTSTFLDTTIIALNGFAISNTGARHNASYVVDAYGPLKIPGG